MPVTGGVCGVVTALRGCVKSRAIVFGSLTSSFRVPSLLRTLVGDLWLPKKEIIGTALFSFM